MSLMTWMERVRVAPRRSVGAPRYYLANYRVTFATRRAGGGSVRASVRGANDARAGEALREAMRAGAGAPCAAPASAICSVRARKSPAARSEVSPFVCSARTPEGDPHGIRVVRAVSALPQPALISRRSRGEPNEPAVPALPPGRDGRTSDLPDGGQFAGRVAPETVRRPIATTRRFRHAGASMPRRGARPLSQTPRAPSVSGRHAAAARRRVRRAGDDPCGVTHGRAHP